MAYVSYDSIKCVKEILILYDSNKLWKENHLIHNLINGAIIGSVTVQTLMSKKKKIKNKLEFLCESYLN